MATEAVKKTKPKAKPANNSRDKATKVAEAKSVSKKTVKKAVNLSAKIYDIKGKAKGSIKLPDNIFGLSWNGDLVHQVVTAIQANERLPYAHTKDRSEVRGGGAKPWRQKGTGRARHGSNRSPIWIGGGVTFGPRKDKNYTQKINKKMRTKALFHILSKKFSEGEIVFVDSLSIKEPKTKDAVSVLENLSKNEGLEKISTKPKNAATIFLSGRDLNTAKSYRNIKSVSVEEVRNMNPLIVLSSKFLIIEKGEDAVKFLESKLENKKANKVK